ncbi:MAG: RNA polymerase-binding protein DksA [Deltaproteobacteria bacterium]|nr:RNA polymerase-binding protein DksA [Deltaproteobacteria bacterium]
MGIKKKLSDNSYIQDLPSDYIPSDKEPYMNKKQLEYFKRKLLSWREKLLRDSYETVVKLKDEGGRETDILDQGTVETNMSLHLRNRDRDRKLIQKIDDALERIKMGTYGYCEESGEEIGLNRLEARPIARLCLEEQELRERRERARRNTRTT